MTRAKGEAASPAAYASLDKAVWIVGTVLVIAAVGFGIFYVRDRYVHASESVVERQTRHLEELVGQNPADPNLRVSVARWYLEAGLGDQAIEQAREALRLQENNLDALILLGQAYTALGDEEQAIAHFTRAVEVSQGNELAMIDTRMNLVYYELGELYRQRGDYARAVEPLQQALKVDRSDADAWYALALTYQAQGDHPAAVESFNEAVRFVPDFAEAYEGLEASYRALGMTTQAAYAEGMVAYGRGDYRQAAQVLETVVREDPEFDPAYLGLGLVYEQLGKEEQAIEALQRFLQAHPESIAARHALGRLTAGAVEP